MTWFECMFTTFGLVMIAFSLGCIVRGENIALLHSVCVVFHGTFIFAYTEHYLTRLAKREREEVGDVR